MEAHQVKAALEQRAEEVCEHLLPGGRVKNGQYKIGSLSGEKGDSRRRSVLRVKSGTERSAVFSGCPRFRNYLPVSTLIACQSVKFLSMPTMRTFCVPDAVPMASSRVVASKNPIKRLFRSMFFIFLRLPCEPLESNLLALLSYLPKPIGSSSAVKLVIIFSLNFSTP